MDPRTGAASSFDHAWRYLKEPEVRFLQAAVARLIPLDELGPGAREAGVVTYIDRQLSGAWGEHARQYRSGPWQEGTPQQGYQSRLTPRELYRAMIAEIDVQCTGIHGKTFHLLAVAEQDQYLAALESNAIEFAAAPAALFFELLLRNTLEGFFADPIYGGNRDKAGWRLIGFPGVAAANYPEHLGHHGADYNVEPVSILDIEEARAATDSQGYARHVASVPRRTPDS
jgi:gluconate 2-dehydrogenase gamma chain